MASTGLSYVSAGLAKVPGLGRFMGRGGANPASGAARVEVGRPVIHTPKREQPFIVQNNKNRPDMGEYRHTKGHHVHAKKAFEGHVNYDPKKGFSISNEFMNKNNIDHDMVTAAQRRLFNELATSQRPNTLQEHTRIAVEALVQGNCPKPLARDLVAQSLKKLATDKVRNPTNIPWHN